MKIKKGIVVHFAELSLKGKNKKKFEEQLFLCIKEELSLKNSDFEKVYGRILIEDELTEERKEKLSKIIGIENFGEVTYGEKNTENLLLLSIKAVENVDAKSFAVRGRRIDKNFELDSQKINEKVGSEIVEQKGWRVDLKNPDVEIEIIILDKLIIVYWQKIKGLGGLPVGSSGQLMQLMSGGIDSPVAAYMMMKRGARVKLIHFHSYPETGRESIEKAKELARKLAVYQGRTEIILVPLLGIQKEIVTRCRPELRVILYRRFMLRIAEMIARDKRIKGLVTGESLGQVASQTIESISVTNQTVEMPVLRPLIGMSKNEIIKIAKQIETYKISILPHGDCCSLFVPKHPVTKPRLMIVKGEEEKLNVSELCKIAIEKSERIEIEA